jgi:hypothetical protein
MYREGRLGNDAAKKLLPVTIRDERLVEAVKVVEAASPSPLGTIETLLGSFERARALLQPTSCRPYGNCLNLDPGTVVHLFDRHGRTGGEHWNSGKECAVHAVYLVPVRDVTQINRTLHDISDAAPGSFDDSANIFERLRRFLAHGAVHNVPVAVDRQLPGNKQKATASHGLRIVSSGLGRRVGLDGFTHTDRRTEAFQVEYRHKLWGPFGLLAFYDLGKVALLPSDISLDHLRHDIGFGAFVRAGNHELMRIYIGFGTGEGSRVHPKFPVSF